MSKIDEFIGKGISTFIRKSNSFIVCSYSKENVIEMQQEIISRIPQAIIDRYTFTILENVKSNINSIVKMENGVVVSDEETQTDLKLKSERLPAICHIPADVGGYLEKSIDWAEEPKTIGDFAVRYSAALEEDSDIILSYDNEVLLANFLKLSKKSDVTEIFGYSNSEIKDINSFYNSLKEEAVKSMPIEKFQKGFLEFNFIFLVKENHIELYQTDLATEKNETKMKFKYLIPTTDTVAVNDKK